MWEVVNGLLSSAYSFFTRTSKHLQQVIIIYFPSFLINQKDILVKLRKQNPISPQNLVVIPGLCLQNTTKLKVMPFHVTEIGGREKKTFLSIIFQFRTLLLHILTYRHPNFFSLGLHAPLASFGWYAPNSMMWSNDDKIHYDA